MWAYALSVLFDRKEMMVVFLYFLEGSCFSLLRKVRYQKSRRITLGFFAYRFEAEQLRMLHMDKSFR